MVDNSLHSNMTVRLDQPGSPLHAKALALKSQAGIQLLVALDHCSLTTAHARALRAAIAAAVAIDVESIVVACSHSHSSPMSEPMGGPQPYFDFIVHQAVDAAVEALATCRPARIGFGQTNVTGASFNTRLPLSDGRVRYCRDWREGLAGGRPVDPRLSVMRIDDTSGKPIAAWVRFAAHPACVIFDAPISGEYPGYLTESLSQGVGGGVPVLFGYGASGDVNCVPMFGSEQDARHLGVRLADLAAEVFETIATYVPERVGSGRLEISLPLDAPPSIQQLDSEINQVQQFMVDVDRDPTAEWVLGINCRKEWPAKNKKNHVLPLAQWAERMKQWHREGRQFPSAWPVESTAWILDEWAMLFTNFEPLVRLGLELAARSPTEETFLMALCNGSEGYLGTDDDRQRGGYETFTQPRYLDPERGNRPLPFALGAAEVFLTKSLSLLNTVLKAAR
jgi:hypothetical protein